MSQEVIEIRGLTLRTRIGVPDQEREQEQELKCDLKIRPPRSFAQIQDEVGETIDYQAVCLRIEQLASERPRKLIETLASEIAEAVLTEFAAQGVTVQIRKYILPQTEFVGVRLHRDAPAP